jgi:hypothetical protein
MMWLSHRLFRSNAVLGPNRLASLGGGSSARGTVREGVDEVGGVVVLGASGPGGQPLGPTFFLIVWWISVL